jgi:hypothetical protein
VPREDGFLKIVGKGERAAVARVSESESGSGARRWNARGKRRRKWSAPRRRRPSGRRRVTGTRAWWWRLPHRWRRRRCRPRHKVSGGAAARCVMQGSSVPFSASWMGKGESGVFFHVGLGYSTWPEEESCICLELGSTKRPDHESDC